MKQRTVFLDIDGTLLPFGEQQIAFENHEAIKLARRKGHKVYICTGRGADAVGMVEPKEVDGFVLVNGCMVIEHGQVVYEDIMPMDIVDDIVKAALAYDMGIFLSGRKDYILGKRREEVETQNYHRPMPKEHHQRMLRIYNNGTDYHDSAIYKVNVTTYDVDKTRALIDHWGTKYTVVPGSIMPNSNQYYEITGKASNKYEGIKWVCKTHGYDLDGVIAIGDSMNDYEMIRDSALGIAMGNGEPTIMAVSKWVTKPSEELGVAFALNKELNLGMDDLWPLNR